MINDYNIYKYIYIYSIYIYIEYIYQLSIEGHTYAGRIRAVCSTESYHETTKQSSVLSGLYLVQ